MRGKQNPSAYAQHQMYYLLCGTLAMSAMLLLITIPCAQLLRNGAIAFSRPMWFPALFPAFYGLIAVSGVALFCAACVIASRIRWRVVSGWFQLPSWIIYLVVLGLWTWLNFGRGADGIYALNGKRLSLEIMTTVNNKLRQNTIQIITAQLKQAGIEIKMSLNPNIFAGADKDKHSLAGGDFDMALFAWLGAPAVADRVPIYHSVEHGAQQQNYVWGNDPRVDELLGKMVVEPDATKAADLANQADAQLWTDMFTLPLYQKPDFLACNSRLTPYNPSTKRGVGDNASQDSPAWNSQTWTVQ